MSDQVMFYLWDTAVAYLDGAVPSGRKQEIIHRDLRLFVA